MRAQHRQRAQAEGRQSFGQPQMRAAARHLPQLGQRLAEQMGGSIAVTSQVGCGSTFTLRLPAVA